MRPTVQESLAGIVRVLRGTVAPNVDDDHAHAQLRQAIRVLEQLPADPRAEAAAELEAVQAIADACNDWIAAERDRARFTPIAAVDPARRGTPDLTIASMPIEVVEESVEDVRTTVEQFLVELREWRATNGMTSSQEIFTQIGTSLAAPRTGSR